MEIPLKPEYETMIRERLETGHYKTAAAVVEEGLRLLAEQEGHARLHEDLKRDVQEGLDQLEAGEYTDYASGKELLHDIQERGQQRLRERRKGGSF